MAAVMLGAGNTTVEVTYVAGTAVGLHVAPTADCDEIGSKLCCGESPFMVGTKGGMVRGNYTVGVHSGIGRAPCRCTPCQLVWVHPLTICFRPQPHHRSRATPLFWGHSTPGSCCRRPASPTHGNSGRSARCTTGRAGATITRALQAPRGARAAKAPAAPSSDSDSDSDSDSVLVVHPGSAGITYCEAS